LGIFKNTLEYRSYNDLVDLLSIKCSDLLNKYDLIVGIPRSGMIPAYIIGLYLHLPVLDFESFVFGLSPSGGFRTKYFPISNYKNVLIVDDSIQNGDQNEIIRKRVEHISNHNFYFLAVFSSESSKFKVDIYFELINAPRVFQWNILKSWIYEYSCVDIDGVLCIDPTEEENDDGDKYLHFLDNASPKFLPPCKVNVLVTSRLEKYRFQTDAWLKKNGVHYNHLEMLDLPDKATGVRLGVHASFKSDIYSKYDNSLLFIESSKHQAEFIHRQTGKNVFCVDNMLFYKDNNNVKSVLFETIWKCLKKVW